MSDGAFAEAIMQAHADGFVTLAEGQAAINRHASNITAKVEAGPPPVIPPRPTVYMLHWWDGSTWRIGYETDSREWLAGAMQPHHPGSRIVTIPGDLTPGEGGAQ